MSGSTPGWVPGYVPSAGEWNQWWGKKLDVAGGALIGPLINGAIAETASDLQPARHLSNLVGKTSGVVAIVGDSTSTAGPDPVGTAGGTTTANGVDPSQMLWAMLCDKLRGDNPQISSWTFNNFGIGGTAENALLQAGSALGVPLPPWFTNPANTWLSYVQASTPDVLFYLFGTNSSAAGAPPAGGGGGPGAATFISDNLAAIDAWSVTPNVVMVVNKTSTPADTTAGPDDLNSSNHLGQASFHRTFARSGAGGYTAFPKCQAKGFGLVDLGRYAAARLYGYDPAAQYMRAVAAAIVTNKPLVSAQLNVAGSGTVGYSTHGDFRLTFVLRGMGGSALNDMGVSAIQVGMSNFIGNSIRLQIGSPQPTGTLWPMYLVDGNIFGAPSQMGAVIATTTGQDVVVTVSASGAHIRVWINGTLGLDVLGPRFVTPTYPGGCPINVVTSVAPTGSPVFDVTEFYEGVGTPAMITTDYASAFGTHASGNGALDGYQGGNAINHQTSLSAAYDRRVIAAMNFSVAGLFPATRPAVSGSRGGNAALASLITVLAGLGHITDSTTA